MSAKETNGRCTRPRSGSEASRGEFADSRSCSPADDGPARSVASFLLRRHLQGAAREGGDTDWSTRRPAAHLSRRCRHHVRSTPPPEPASRTFVPGAALRRRRKDQTTSLTPRCISGEHPQGMSTSATHRQRWRRSALLPPTTTTLAAGRHQRLPAENFGIITPSSRACSAAGSPHVHEHFTIQANHEKTLSVVRTESQGPGS